VTPTNVREEDMDRAGETVRDGLVAGAVATAAMSGVMRAAQAMGLLGKLPPRKITDRALDAAGAEEAPRPARSLAATLAHVGFGVGCAALYALVHRRVRRILPAPLAGAAFGTLVWAASYAGWIPALGIMPPPNEDSPGRAATMVAAHWVYGGVMGAVLDRRF
jgi:hypothetical protein